MLFGLIRFIIMLVMIIVSFKLINKSKVINKKCLYVISVVFTMVFCIVLCFIPIENTFITFPSPETAFRYSNVGDIYEIVEGSNSALIISKGSNGTELSVVPKSENGWKLGIGMKTYSLIIDEYGTIVVDILKNENTCDCYIAINDIKGKELKISDNYSSKFLCVSRRFKGIEDLYNCYYAYIGEFDNQYILTVNGEEIVFK